MLLPVNSQFFHVHRMAQNEPEHTLPVFVQNNSLPAFDKKDFSTAEICSYAEKTTGFNSIIGAQKISGLWRICPRDKGGRQKLLIQGMTVRGVQVTVKDKNPYLVRSLDGKEEETPATKVIVGNVPISFSDQEILKSVQELGCTLRSKLILERDRDEKGKLTHWLTGRIIYVSVPREPLPKFIQVGPFKASVYHREQKNILREAAADCRNCLQKGQHKTADCPNPVKRRQCLADGHRAGDNVCSLIPEANNDTDVDDSSAFFTPTKNPPNQTDKRQANKQNKTLVTDYTTRQHKKSGAASDSQQMPPPARGRSPRRQNRAHSTRDDSLKRRRSPTGDTPPTDRRARLQEVAEQTGDEDSASEDRWSNCT